MLLDVYVLKQGLLELPVLNTDLPVPPPALYISLVWKLVDGRYVKFVNKTIAKIETILKLILTAKDPPAGLVQNYFFLIADKSVRTSSKSSNSRSFNPTAPQELHIDHCRVFEKPNKIPS
jgi:hypothetical protein